jgi:hypothetical protein
MPSASKDDLLKRKQDLLRKQKRVCEEMNELLTRDETGLNEVSRMTKRSLEVAIVLSKRPGAIDYYEQPEETQTIVRNNDLKNLSKRVDRIQGEIDSVDAELEQIEAMRKKPTLGAGTEMTSIRQWMARHGDPKPAPNGFYSEFQNDRKIYGGTNHHKAFKTQSTTMKRGMMTR